MNKLNNKTQKKIEELKKEVAFAMYLFRDKQISFKQLKELTNKISENYKDFDVKIKTIYNAYTGVALDVVIGVNEINY